MKTHNLSITRVLLMFSSLILSTTCLPGQSYTLTGTNQPGTAQNLAISLTAGTTNLSVSVAGTANNYSHLLLKAGLAPGDADYDFIAARNGVANAINLEAPEFKLTNYVLQVRTPADSQAHSFTVTVSTNVSDLRTLTRPATKAIASTNQGALTVGTWHYYRIEIPANMPGWRAQLSSTNNGPDLYIQRDALPTTSAYLKRSQSSTNDELAFAASELTAGAYFVGVFQPSSSAVYTLRTEAIQFTTLTWDPGATHLGTQVYTNGSTNAADYYFKITTQNTSLGAWRTALNVSTGEANLYLAKGLPPTAASNLYKSERSGSDGFVVPSSAFSAGEDWYYLVRAEAGAQWNLVSGEPFVTDLGVVATNATSGSGEVVMGAEGMRFFQTTMPADAGAWRLWLNGITNTLFVKKTAVPLVGSTDLSQAGQMLVVPSYLVGGQLYFVGVSGVPGSAVNLDSRLQSFTDIPFVTSTNLVVAGYGYTTFRVQVPVDQLGWQMSVAVNSGNPNLAVRRNFIPNENNNEAYSEVAGMVTDSITLVPPTLSDGTFYITVYSTNDYSCTLQSGPPEFTEISFTSATTNTDTNRVGWRFFKLSNISEQVGTLGWDLFVTNFAPGTRIALRRNAAPGIWNFRNPTAGAAGSYDFLSTADFLQRPGHQADIWYVGVFNTNTALGDFTLVTRELSADPLPFDGGATARVAVPPGKWQFFRVDAPADILGWDLRLANVTAGSPQIVVRRELLPVSLVNIGFSIPITLTNWPTGNQWAAGADWTARNFSADGSVNENGRVLTMGYGRPLETATYYVGVISSAGASNALSYTVVSRGIGTNQAISVQNIDYLGGSATNAGLGARDIAVYRVAIQSNTPSWKVRLAINAGDAVLAVAKDRIPNITAALSGSVTNVATAGKKMLKAGNEHFVQLPPLEATNLLAGDYYLLVASEGLVGGSSTSIGTGNAGYTLQSVGPLPTIDLGLLDTEDLVYTGTLEGGEATAFHFHNYPFPLTLGFELSLEDRVGNPVMVSSTDLDLLNPGAASTGSGGGVSADAYGNEGGVGGTFVQASAGFITASGAWPDETIMLKARAQSGGYPDAEYTLRVRKLTVTPMAFDSGTATVVDQTNIYEFFRVDIPPGTLGWDVRVTNVIEGQPLLIANHEFLPLDIVTSSWNPGVASIWPYGANWIADKDWTERTFSADGSSNEDGRILAMGMGQPMEAGTYYLAVYNPAYPLPISYTISSRGIGETNLIPVLDLPFAAGSIITSNLPAREAAYYRVVIPTNAASWRVKLTALAGESMLVMLTNHVPSVLSGKASNAGEELQKSGNEHFVMLPVSPHLTLTPGTNYLAVVSEGVGATNATRIGAGVSSFVIESRGELPVVDLGLAGTTNLTYDTTQEGGEVRAYQFTVPPGMTSLEVQLQNITGNPAMVLRVGSALPNPGAASPSSGAGSVSAEPYGNEGGYPIAVATGNANTNLISVANPLEGVYTVMVKARASIGTTFTNASYTLVVRATTYTAINFDGVGVVVTNHPANTWRYYRVEVPTNALGWDLRLANVISGLPKLVVTRDVLPDAISTKPWSVPGTSLTWPTTNQWAAGGDWTRRSSSADGSVVEDNRILAMGMGQPLEPGTYYIGVINTAGTTNLSYTLLSRGIGADLSIPVQDLNFTGGSVTVSNLAPREAAYFRVQVPTNTPGWKMKLTPTVGEAMLVVLSNRVPNVDSGRLSGALNGKSMQKAGNEHYLVLPLAGQSNVIAGTYYLAAISEGINPATVARIGSGSSTFTVTSIGNIPVADLGGVGPTDIVVTNSLEGGESRIYQFTVPPTMAAVELRLENRVGNPVMVMGTNSLPDPGGLSSPRDIYGNDGGATPNGIHTNILTIVNPTNGLYTLAVKARAFGAAYPDASYTLRVREIPVPELNFTSEFNTNGLSHVAAGILLDSQRVYYKVVIPPNLNGAPILGWQLDLSQSSGQAGLRVRKDLLPSDAVQGMPFTPNAAVIAPPVLTNGTWYVEVRGTNSTAFTLVSSALALQRPAWQMPSSGELPTTPGLAAPFFGDSGVDTNGVSLPADQGIDLPLGGYHYYAIEVPTNNGGLLRVQLEGISGNPDAYIRSGLVPTASHSTNFIAGTMLERSLTSVATDYGNFVPLNGRSETGLAAGTWYLAVRAVANANARYRLRLSTGTIQDLPIDGGVASDQSVSGSDWRYYRVQIPAEAPANWSVSFSQISGDVVMHVRDTVPPGNGATTNATEYKDWVSDVKNAGPYANYDAPGNYTFTVPPLRPNTVYYLGFRAKNDSTFSVASTVSGITNQLAPIIPFYNGSVTNTIPANSQIAYRILTPSDALRWRTTTIHSNSVQIYIENGTFPIKTAADDYRSVNANSVQDRFLNAYPWLPDQTYYMIVSNSSAVVQFFNFNMIGSSVTADDDGDGMQDDWEVRYWGGLTAQPNADADADGVSNLNEFLEGTLPFDKTSFRPRLTILATNGVVSVNPATTNYAQGDIVTLTATPDAGYEFVGWGGHVNGITNQIVVTMNTNKIVIPRFRVPGDDFDQRIQLNGPTVTHSGLQNVGASKEFGEPNHAGNSGGKSLWWTWTAPASGPVTVTTEGSTFRNALAVYTGPTVSNLTMITTNLAGAGTNTSQVTFAATGGTTYHFAVDGFNGATGSVVVNLSLPVTTIALSQPARAEDGFFHFTITSAPGLALRVDATTNLTTWTTIATVTNVTGTMDFADTNSPSFKLRFYRVVQPAATIQPLLLSNASRLGNGQFRFNVVGAVSQIVRLEATTNEALTGWTTLATITNTSGTDLYTDVAAPNFSRRFYRAVAP
jgi:hypothetical protein